MSNLRTAVEMLLQERTGKRLMTWLVTERNNNVSLRDIANELYALTNIPVSHQTIADWLREG
jgi:transposase-like protein